MTTQLLSLGLAITSANEVLQNCLLEDVYHRVAGIVPSTLEYDVARLRKLMTLDKVAYKTAKTRLPYVVGSDFQGGVRRIENMSGAHYFILDIDHVKLVDGKIPDAIVKEPSVALAFISPSGEGVKVFCKLDVPCMEPKRFSAIYKIFASSFADRVGLAGSMDLRTSDVSRACFLSYDVNAFYNPNAAEADWRALEGVQDVEDVTASEKQPAVAAVSTTEKRLNEQAYKNILREINPNTPVRKEREVFVPQQLLDLLDRIPELCKVVNLEITKTERIQYGLKIGATQGYRSAEVNIFYGKKGFSVIISPRTGTDTALNDLLHGCIFQHLFPPTRNIDISLAEYFSTN